jgi:hypothetical protein
MGRCPHESPAGLSGRNKAHLASYSNTSQPTRDGHEPREGDQSVGFRGGCEDDTDDDANGRDDDAGLATGEVAEDTCGRGRESEPCRGGRRKEQGEPMETCPRMVPTVRELLRRVDMALL